VLRARSFYETALLDMVCLCTDPMHAFYINVCAKLLCVICALLNGQDRAVFFARLDLTSEDLDAAHRVTSGQFGANGSPFGHKGHDYVNLFARFLPFALQNLPSVSRELFDVVCRAHTITLLISLGDDWQGPINDRADALDCGVNDYNSACARLNTAVLAAGGFHTGGYKKGHAARTDGVERDPENVTLDWVDAPFRRLRFGFKYAQHKMTHLSAVLRRFGTFGDVSCWAVRATCSCCWW
jgi:hypothetical protein